ncbi:MAG: Ig-like domain-containing protein [Alphaproteobacteria bacterium]|nr:Ig-like domain-containing protein [Alphaproteobacteria bacterium]
MTSLLLALLPLGLLSCKDKGGALDTGGDDDSGYSSIETGVVPDDSGDTATDTGGTDSGGGDTGDTVELAVTGLSAWPTSMTVDVGATWSLRTVATWEDGTVADVSPEWATFDPSVARVDGAGIVTANGPGATTLTATYGDATTSVEVLVHDDDQVTITVIEARSGLPRAGAHVRVGPDDSVEGLTDTDGRVTLSWSDPGPVDVTAWDHLRVPVTVVGAVGRTLTLPLRMTADVAVDRASVSGPVDLSGVESGGVGDHKLGIALGSMPDGPLLLDPDLLLGPNKDVTLYGVTASVPGNLYARDAAESYVLDLPVGTSSLWTLSAPLPIDDVTSGLAGATDALALMLDHLDDVAWDWSDPVSVGPDEAVTVPLAPSVPVTETWSVDVGELPVGFSGDEDALVLVGERLPAQGLVPAGVGVGRFAVDVYGGASPYAGEGVLQAAAIAQVGGLGSGTGMGIVASQGAVASSGLTTLPALPRVPTVYRFDPATKDWSLETDGRMRFVHVLIRGGGDESTELRELVLDGGAAEGALADLREPFGWGRTTWEIVAIEPATGSFHDHVRDGWPADADLARDAWTSGMLTLEP